MPRNLEARLTQNRKKRKDAALIIINFSFSNSTEFPVAAQRLSRDAISYFPEKLR
jgi:hypothetical protein